MASIRKEILVNVPPEEAWDALRDWGALHERLVPGFVVDAQLDGEDRIVTFFNGTTARERFVSCDDDARRLVWSIPDAPYVHHNGAAEVLDQGDGSTRFVWTADFLPHALADQLAPAMERGLATIKQTLEAAVRS
jgi:carbon monoxide dehydrogenase subunit G